MQNANHFHLKRKEPDPGLSAGLFFILLGLALLVVTNDLFNLGGFREYITWQNVLIFIGTVFLINFRFIPGLLLIATGIWFLLDEIFYLEVPRVIEVAYWPAVMMLLGIIFIISALLKRMNN